MNAAVVKRTQEALGKVIRRPPLTEKLLNKPPFRYLHDIITEVIRTTGFMKGLYTDAEMKSDNVKDKDAKISFLQKAIDVVVMVSGEPLSAKPARIVAGHEPEKTNELLQKIGKCCLNKLSSEDVVKRVLAGAKGDGKGRLSLVPRPPEADCRAGREAQPRVPKEREDRRNSEKNERSTSRDRKQKEELKEESKPREKERDMERTKENDHDRHKDPERDKHQEGERERTKTRARRDRDRDPDRERERKNEGGKEKERERDRARRRVRDREHPRAPDRDRGREHEKPERKTEVSTRTSKSLTTKTSKWRSKTSVEGTKEANANSASVSDDQSPSLWCASAEPGPAVTQKGDSPSDAEGEVGPVGPNKPEVSESSAVPSELPSSLRRISRPGSARPAPPRVKRQDSVEVLTVDRAGSGKAVSNVIVESQNSDNEEDEQFVVEAAPQLPEMAELDVVQAVDLEEDEKHGGLVKKILETKKDYEKLQLSPKPGEKEKLPVFESAWKKEKDIVSKEMEKLRVSIQTLCKSALPLGKTMDYLQEDVDAMQHELQLWHSENKQHAEALQEEQSITDSAVEPLRAQLAELEQLIKDQQDKICAVKANILRNEEKIQKMVYSINLSSRR